MKKIKKAAGAASLVSHLSRDPNAVAEQLEADVGHETAVNVLLEVLRNPVTWVGPSTAGDVITALVALGEGERALKLLLLTDELMGENAIALEEGTALGESGGRAEFDGLRARTVWPPRAGAREAFAFFGARGYRDERCYSFFSSALATADDVERLALYGDPRAGEVLRARFDAIPAGEDVDVVVALVDALDAFGLLRPGDDERVNREVQPQLTALREQAKSSS